jgi:hypothetical protein
MPRQRDPTRFDIYSEYVMPHDVFISHSSKDKSVADAVCATLEASGIRCWIAPRDVLPGANWGEAIIDALSTSKAMVLIFSANSNESGQVVREVERAINKNIPVIPFRIENVPLSKAMEYFISTAHWLDAFPLYESHLAVLSQRLVGLIQHEPCGDRTERMRTPTTARRTTGTGKFLLIGAALTTVLITVFTWAVRSLSPLPVAQTPPPSLATGNDAEPDRLKAGLGIACEALPEVNADWLGITGGGLVVRAVVPDSTADQDGIKHGDILMMFNGLRMSRVEDLPDVSDLPIGSTHTLTLIRDGKQETVTLTLRPYLDVPKGFTPPAIDELRRITLNAGVLTGLRAAGHRICSATGKGDIGVWDYTGNTIKRAMLTSGQSADLTSDGALAVVSERHGALATWNTLTGQKKKVLTENEEAEINGPVRIDGAGSRVASIKSPGILQMWDPQAGASIYEVKLLDEFKKLGRDGEKLFSFLYSLGPFSPSGRYLMVGATQSLFIWNVENRIIDWSWTGDTRITSFAPSPDWSLCAVGYGSGTIRILELRNTSDRIRLRGHSGPVVDLSWHGNNLLASASEQDRSVRVWNVGEGKQLWQFNVAQSSNFGLAGPNAVCFDPDAPRLWTGVFDVRCFVIPPLEKEAWEPSGPLDEAIEFGSAIKKHGGLQLGSGSDAKYPGGRHTAKYSFSDQSVASGEKDLDSGHWRLRFTAADGETVLNATVGFLLDSTCKVIQIEPNSTATSAGLRKGDILVGYGESTEGPFFSMPAGDDAATEILRLRILAGSSGSTLWLRVGDLADRIRTIGIQRE